MCGIAGLWRGRAAASRDELLDIGRRMSDAIARRGPDSAGEWADANHGLVLAHRRLAIIDLSADGRQPMESHCGRYVLIYNGEIYNYQALRREIDGSGNPARWRGHSDTEVLLEGVVRWGVTETLRRASGMFALALWDRELGELHLARDRLGEKPLYWGLVDGSLAFGSELHALRQVPGVDRGPDPCAVSAYLRLGYVPAPLSILRGVQKLPPASIATFVTRDGAVVERSAPSLYWDLRAVAKAGMNNPLRGSTDELRERLDQCLRGAVAEKMVADVPVGAFLSGGIDSSLVVALMCRSSSAQVRTFSVGFETPEFDETRHAAVVAKHLGTAHTEIRFTEQQALDLVPDLARIYDEPFADSSQLPTTMVARETRRYVTVALTGDGGDELFWGYDRYRRAARLAGVPRAFTGLARGALVPSAWIAGRMGYARTSDRASKLADLLGFSDMGDAYLRMMSTVPGEMAWAGAGELLRDRWNELPEAELFARMAYTDQCTYLPDDVLVKVDRASMWSSLESRVPMLDHAVVEFAWSLPAVQKFHGGIGKRLLRELLYKYVPRPMVDRPKSGFAVPLEGWLRGPLRAWLLDTLSESAVRNAGSVDWGLVKQMLDEHLSGRRRWHAALWSFAMLHQWLATPSASVPVAVGR